MLLEARRELRAQRRHQESTAAPSRSGLAIREAFSWDFLSPSWFGLSWKHHENDFPPRISAVLLPGLG